MLTGFAAELDCAFVLCFIWCVCMCACLLTVQKT